MDVVTAAWAALAEIDDPCSTAVGCPISLVDMRIVRTVEVLDGRLRVVLQLTEPSCIFAFHMVEEAQARLRDALGEDQPFEVRLSHDYPEVWTEDLIAPAARDRLDESRRRRLLPLSPLGASKLA